MAKPASMEWSPEIEFFTLYGKSILEYTKKELSAFIVYLMEKHKAEIEEKNRQIQFITTGKRR